MKNAVVEILIPKGEPNGLKIVKLAGWIGKAFVIPRADLSEIKGYQEASLPAIYFLFSEAIDKKPIMYVGQTDNLWRRLSQQSVHKEDWNIALVFTGEKDVDVRYLEQKATNEAISAGRYELANKVTPSGSSLSDFSKASNDNFFENVKFITSLLGFPVFKVLDKKIKQQNIYYLEDLKNKDAQGKGTLLDTGEFIVFKGSKARAKVTEGFLKQKWSISLRLKLEEMEVLKLLPDGISFIFMEDYIFTSPSSAADTIMGRSCNGWTGWKNENGITLDEIKRLNK